jgi:hypothetical protein
VASQEGGACFGGVVRRMEDEECVEIDEDEGGRLVAGDGVGWVAELRGDGRSNGSLEDREMRLEVDFGGWCRLGLVVVTPGLPDCNC